MPWRVYLVGYKDSVLGAITVTRPNKQQVSDDTQSFRSWDVLSKRSLKAMRTRRKATRSRS